MELYDTWQDARKSLMYYFGELELHQLASFIRQIDDEETFRKTIRALDDMPDVDWRGT